MRLKADGRVDGCECDTDPQGDNGCVEGRWYGYCDHPDCGGFCDWQGDCRCPCHGSPA